MTSAQLRAVFRRALQASVVAPLALTACGPDTTGYTPVTCESGLPTLTGLAPPVIPDVMQLRAQYGQGAATRASTVGTPCATATDAGACVAAFDALPSDAGFADRCEQICVSYSIATTRGDEVAALASLSALRTFLGPIDTAQEALLVAFANGYDLSCSEANRGSAKRSGTGWDVLATRGFACGAGTALVRHYLFVASDGQLTPQRSEVIEYGAPNCAVGRRPPGLLTSGRGGCDEALGQALAEIAHLEAASVPAFEQLAAELALHGAPEELTRAALLAALDEIDHTRRMTALAHRFGARVTVPELTAQAPRPLLALACDNAVEGCVRETFGALVAHHQAEHATDPEVRATMRVIAEDETRHAELSWAIDAWAMSVLDEADRAAVKAARRGAVARLWGELDRPVDAQLAQLAGQPVPAVAQRLFASLEDALLAA